MATDLFILGSDLLDAVTGHFTTAAVSLPGRQYVTVGTPVTDCEQVVVAIPSLFSGLPGSAYVGPVRPGVTDSVEFALYVVRCVPTLSEKGNPPTPAKLQESAEELLQDASLIREASFAARRGGVFGDCNDVVIAECVALGPEGGYGGWRQTLRVGL